MLPKVIRMLFENEGRGPKLRSDIIPGSGIPTGVICMWSGTVATVPSGWGLCNGANGTPNLCDRFIVGAGSTYAPKATGGANTHTHTATAASVAAATTISSTAAATTISSTAAATTIGATTLTVAQIPSHSHVIQYDSGSAASGPFHAKGTYGAARDRTYSTDTTGGSGSHTHTATGTAHTHTATGTAHTHTATGTAHTHTLTVADGNNMPLYYALAYIMKL